MRDRLRTRRAFLRSVVLGAATLPWLRATDILAAEALPRLAEADEAAKALGYVEEVSKLDASKKPNFKKGSNCANCTLYQNAQEKDGYAPCSAFPGKTVSAKGWCRVWVAKS